MYRTGTIPECPFIFGILLFYIGVKQMARVNAEEFQEKHARRLKAATPDIELGVSRVAVSPTAEAAKKKDKMLRNITESINNGKWERGLLKVSKEEWQEKMISKGIPRIAAGIDGAKAKVIDFATKLLPHIDSGVSKVKGMPDMTLADSANRMVSFMNHMATFKK